MDVGIPRRRRFPSFGLPELFVAYLEFARGYYTRDGATTTEYRDMKAVLQDVGRIYRYRARFTLQSVQDGRRHQFVFDPALEGPPHAIVLNLEDRLHREAVRRELQQDRRIHVVRKPLTQRLLGRWQSAR